MQGNPLYSAKLATERVRLAMTLSDFDRAEFLTRLADRRVTEIYYVVTRG